MIKRNRHRYEIENSDKNLAIIDNWNSKHRTYIGNLGEIAACEYLGVTWNSTNAAADIVDRHGTRYQVKTTPKADLRNKTRHWLEQKQVRSFDRYIFVSIDEGELFANIEMDTLEMIPHKNSHWWDGELEAIYRK